MTEKSGGVFIAARLAAARAVVWLGWKITTIGMRVLLRKDHPFRTFIIGAEKEAMPVQLASLRHTNGPRWSLLTRWKLTAGAVAALAWTAAETELLRDIVAFASEAM